MRSFWNEQGRCLKCSGRGGDVRRHVPCDGTGIQRIEQIDGSIDAHSSKDSDNVLLGIIEERALIESVADARKLRLHLQPLKQGLPASGCTDDGDVAVGCTMGEVDRSQTKGAGLCWKVFADRLCILE